MSSRLVNFTNGPGDVVETTESEFFPEIRQVTQNFVLTVGLGKTVRERNKDQEWLGLYVMNTYTLAGECRHEQLNRLMLLDPAENVAEKFGLANPSALVARIFGDVCSR